MDDKQEPKKIDARKIPNPKHYPKSLLEYNKMNPTVSFKLNAEQKLRLMNKAIEKNMTLSNYCRSIILRYGLGDLSLNDIPQIREERNESYDKGFRDGMYHSRATYLLISVFVVVFLMICTALSYAYSPYDPTRLFNIYITTECVLLGFTIYFLVRS